MNTKYLIEEQTLTDIANSIREMEGSDDAILVEEYASKIINIDLATSEYLLLDSVVQNEHTNISNLTVNSDDVNELNYFLNIYRNEMEGIK